jgi:histidine phosphotransferase ChpT
LTGAGENTVITPRAAAAYLVHSIVMEGKGTIQVSEPEDPVLLFGATLTIA